MPYYMCCSTTCVFQLPICFDICFSCLYIYRIELYENAISIDLNRKEMAVSCDQPNTYTLTF